MSDLPELPKCLVNGEDKELKEKVCVLYQQYFLEGSEGNLPPSFYEEMLLLRPNDAYLKVLFSPSRIRVYLNHRPHFCQYLLRNMILFLAGENPVRRVHCLQTLTIIVKQVLLVEVERLEKIKHVNDLCYTLFGGEQAVDEWIEGLGCLLGETIEMDKQILSILMCFITSSKVVKENRLLRHFLKPRVVENIVKILAVYPLTDIHKDIVLMIVVLQAYPVDGGNPMRRKLAGVKDSKVLQVIAKVLDGECLKCCERYERKRKEREDSVVNWIGSVVGQLVGQRSPTKEESGEERRGSTSYKRGKKEVVRYRSSEYSGAMLMFLYELVRHNVYFASAVFLMSRKKAGQAHDSGEEDEGMQLYVFYMPKLYQHFLTLLSYMLRLDSEGSFSTGSRLCLMVLQSLLDATDVMSRFHDLQYKCTIPLLLTVRGKSRNVARHQLVIEHILHICMEGLLVRKRLSFRNIIICLRSVHTILCFEKSRQIQLSFDWLEMVAGLLAIMKELNVNPAYAATSIREVGLSLIQLLNFLVTFGDVVFATSSDYDDFIYTLIQWRSTISYFRNRLECDIQDCSDVVRHLSNIIKLCRHFGAKIDHWTLTATAESGKLSKKVILRIIEGEYASLNLTYQPGLDDHQPFDDASSADFREALITAIITDYNTPST